MSVVADLVSKTLIADYRRDGAVCLPGVFSDWVEVLRRGVQRNLAEPGPYASENTQAGESGRFFDDYCNWQRIPEYRDFIYHSPAAMVAAHIMESETAQFFHEHVLIKEPGTAKITPWHQDLPYYCVEGRQTVSMWIVLDPVRRSTCLQFVAGSHRWPKQVRPQHWLDDSDFYAGEDEFMDIPDIDAQPDAYRILNWDLQPGDAVLFNYLTVHGAPGNATNVRRRAFSARWVGDDVCFVQRPGRTSPPFPGINLKQGQRLRDDWFPVVWRGSQNVVS